MEVLKSYYEVSPFFFLITVAASLLFSTMNVLMIFGGDHGDHSHHHHAHDTADHLASDTAFKFFSLQSILAFFMGFGWAGITSTVKWQLSFFEAFPIAFAFGGALMTFSAFLYYQVRKLNNVPVVNFYSAVGTKGTVYARIPGGAEEGKVQIVVSGALKVVTAVSDEAIDSFTEVEVAGVKDKNTLIVKRTVPLSSGENS